MHVCAQGCMVWACGRMCADVVHVSAPWVCMGIGFTDLSINNIVENK